MKKLNNETVTNEYEGLPIKAVQFGEGNFLRAFVDWMFDIMMEKGLYEGRIAVVQPIGKGRCKLLEEQDCMYTVLLRGMKDGNEVSSKRVVKSIGAAVDPYADYEKYLKLAENPALELIISNTTEAGIAYDGGDGPGDRPPSSFPGKLTAFLHRRFETCKGGLRILPCELIDRNGDNLRRIVLRLAREWGLGDGFAGWIESEVEFYNSLVDRIVTGYPSEEEYKRLEKEAGYRDSMYDTGEYYHLWVIEGREFVPLKNAGLNVIWTDDMTPYRTRKVRILNGAHTMTVPAAYLSGIETVGECVQDPLMLGYMQKGIFEEIIPTLDLPAEQLREYANDVLERFSNPYIEHRLLDISLNSVSKFKVRVLPSLIEYEKRKGKLPDVLVFSLAALISFYDGGGNHPVRDDGDVIETVRSCLSRKNLKEAMAALLSKKGIWGLDLNEIEGLAEKTGLYYANIKEQGMREAVGGLMDE